MINFIDVCLARAEHDCQRHKAAESTELKINLTNYQANKFINIGNNDGDSCPSPAQHKSQLILQISNDDGIIGQKYSYLEEEIMEKTRSFINNK